MYALSDKTITSALTHYFNPKFNTNDLSIEKYDKEIFGIRCGSIKKCPITWDGQHSLSIYSNPFYANREVYTIAIKLISGDIHNVGTSSDSLHICHHLYICMDFFFDGAFSGDDFCILHGLLEDGDGKRQLSLYDVFKYSRKYKDFYIMFETYGYIYKVKFINNDQHDIIKKEYLPRVDDYIHAGQDKTIKKFFEAYKKPLLNYFVKEITERVNKENGDTYKNILTESVDKVKKAIGEEREEQEKKKKQEEKFEKIKALIEKIKHIVNLVLEENEKGVKIFVTVSSDIIPYIREYAHKEDCLFSGPDFEEYGFLWETKKDTYRILIKIDDMYNFDHYTLKIHKN